MDQMQARLRGEEASKQARSTMCGEREKLFVCLFLELSLLRLSEEIRHEDIADFVCSFVDVEAHAFSAELLADDVELEAIVDYC